MVQPESKIRHRLKLLRFRYLTKEMRKARSRKPCNCHYNKPAVSGASSVGICMYKGFRGVICDDDYGGIKLASKCPYFEPRITKEEFRAQFQEFFTNAPFEEFASRYPDIVSLLWVLGEPDNRDMGPITDEEISAMDMEGIPSETPSIVNMCSPPLQADSEESYVDMSSQVSDSGSKQEYKPNSSDSDGGQHATQPVYVEPVSFEVYGFPTALYRLVIPGVG